MLTGKPNSLSRSSVSSQTRGTTRFCAHCNQSKNIIYELSPDELWFCCQGCKTVYSLLLNSGLSEYYRQKQNAFCIREPSAAVIANEQFLSWNSSARMASLYLEGVHCTACLWLIEKLPELIPNTAKNVRLDLGRSLLQVSLTPNGNLSDVAELVNSWGYRPHLVTSEKHSYALQEKESRKTLIELGIAGALAGNVMLMSIPLYAGVDGPLENMFAWISAGLTTPALFYSGRSFFLNVYAAFKQKRFSIDAPILLALLVAFAFSMSNLIQGENILYFDSLTALIFLLLASRYLLQRLRQYGLGKGGNLSLLNGDVKYSLGETVSLSADTDVQFDGVVSEGSGYFNLSFLTGESYPVLHKTGDYIYAGSRFIGNEKESTPVKAKVLQLGKDTRIEKILAEVDSAQRKRSHFEHNYDRWAKYLLGFVCLIACGLFTHFAIQQEYAEGIQRTLALLIVTCPCALALATPLTLSLALHNAFRNGVMVKDVDAFEHAINLKNIVFDKTGTITHGQMSVSLFEIPSTYNSVVRALVEKSPHPVARAIYAFLGTGETDFISEYQEISGRGVSGKAKETYWFLEKDPETIQFAFNSVVLKKDSEIVGRVFLSDHTREDAALTVKKLQQQDYSVFLLSGDQPALVAQVAQEIGIPSSNTYARKTPEEKGAFIESLTRHAPTMMVGDGINDAIALSKASVSMAVQGGLEASLKTADIYSLKPGVSAVPEFLRLSLRVKNTLKKNFLFSTTYNLISAALAIGGFMSPLIAAVLMPLSAATVFATTTFSLRWKDEETEAP